MTPDDNITVVPLKELTRLRRIEAAVRELRFNHDWSRNSDDEEGRLINLDIALMTETTSERRTMNDTTTPAAPQFRTVCQIGPGLHVDAMWVTEVCEHVTNHYITFNLTGGFRIGVDSVQIGFRIFAEIDGVMFDEEGCAGFPDLEAAIRSYAERLLQLEWQWTAWQNEPALHYSRGGNNVAFSPQDISFAVKLAAA